MLTRFPGFVVVAAPVILALTMSGSAHAAACATVECNKCQENCLAAYDKKVTAPHVVPADIPIFKKQHHQCMVACTKKK